VGTVAVAATALRCLVTHGGGPLAGMAAVAAMWCSLQTQK